MRITPRLRTILIAVAGAACLLATGLVLGLHWLLQPERFTRRLAAQAQQAGLELKLARPARPDLLPEPALELEGLSLRAGAGGAPILLAERGRLVLPWRALLRGENAIGRLEIQAPRLDFAVLRQWLDGLPPDTAQPRLPRIDTGIAIRGGSLVEGDRVLLDAIDLDSGRLRPDQPFLLTLTARLGHGEPVRLELRTLPRQTEAALQLDELQLHVRAGRTLALQLSGSVRWHGDADTRASLAGSFTQDGRNGTLALTLTPADRHDPLLLHVRADTADAHLDLRTPPLALAPWWRSLDAAPRVTMPPLEGEWRAARLDLGPATIRDFSLTTGAAPSAAGSAPPSS